MIKLYFIIIIFLGILNQIRGIELYLRNNLNPYSMDKILDFFLLILFAFGSAIIFTLAVIWKFMQAMYELAFGTNSNQEEATKHLH